MHWFPSSPATKQTSHHVYRFWTALLQCRLRRTCSIHINHESAMKGLQKKCCDERNVFIVIDYSIVNLSFQPCLANINIAEAGLGSPCIYFRHSLYMYFSQGDAFTTVIIHACTAWRTSICHELDDSFSSGTDYFPWGIMASGLWKWYRPKRGMR